MLSQMITNPNEPAKEPIPPVGALLDSDSAKQPESPAPYKPYTEPAAPEPYRPYAEKPALLEPPYQPYKGI